MKKQWMCWLLGIAVLLVPLGKARAQDPITLVIREGIKKAIRAVDLKIQRLQTKTIWLQNAQKAVENKMTQLKLREIACWVEQQRDLYKDYFDELYRVKNGITLYHRTREVFQLQVQLVEEYKLVSGQLKKDRHFAETEVAFMEEVYSGILKESLENLENLQLVIRSFSTQMSDAARLEMINRVADAVRETYDDLKRFSNQNAVLSLSRAREARDIGDTKRLYHLK